MVVGRLLSYWEGNFSGAMLNLVGVNLNGSWVPAKKVGHSSLVNGSTPSYTHSQTGRIVSWTDMNMCLTNQPGKNLSPGSVVGGVLHSLVQALRKLHGVYGKLLQGQMARSRSNTLGVSQLFCTSETW